MEAGEGRLFLGDSAALSLRSKQPIGVKPFPDIGPISSLSHAEIDSLLCPR